MRCAARADLLQRTFRRVDSTLIAKQVTMIGGRLELGWRGPLLVREEVCTVRPDGVRVLYVSDVHLRKRRSTQLSEQVVRAAVSARPDVVLLGGDLVDQSTELPALTRLTRRLAEATPLLAVGGNHDEAIGLGRVADAVRRGGGVWMHDGRGEVRVRGRVISVIGPRGEQGGGGTRIVCGHFARGWRQACRSGADLVLAGHVHGGQFVAFEARGRLWPAAAFYRGACLRRKEGRSWLIVSRGVSDLIPVRWQCPREVVLCVV